MNTLSTLTQTLQNIKQVCININKKSVNIMKNLIDDDNESVSLILEKYPNKDKHSLADMVRTSSLNILHDSDIIRGELDDFAKSIAHNISLETYEGCPFLRQVWFGDAYGEIELDGLEQLLKDLDSQLESISYESIANKVMNEF
jgi:hypothetical protein